MGLTEDQQKGLDIMSKILNKVYPYIIGISPNIGDFEEYSTIFTIKLIVSKSKLEDHFKQKTDRRWNEFWRFGNIFDNNPDPEELIINDIKNLGRLFYLTMTDEYHFKSSLDSKDFRNIEINSFILDDKN
jgi:hypothetical protein